MQVKPLVVDPVKRMWRFRDLLWQMTERDTRSRYRGSAMGLVWSAVTPLLMLGLYTYFFSEVFQAKWEHAAQGKVGFALTLFIGLLLHGFLSECINRAPKLIVENPNLVKKVVFPLFILPMVSLGSALAHLLVGLAIWLAFAAVTQGMPQPTTPLILLVVAPLAVMTLGLCWVLASLGVYLRDLAHVTPIVSAVLLFASPVFYPVSALPEPMRSLIWLSPLTLPIEQARRVLIAGQVPDWTALVGYTVAAFALAGLGLAWFEGTSKGFADVV